MTEESPKCTCQRKTRGGKEKVCRAHPLAYYPTTEDLFLETLEPKSTSSPRRDMALDATIRGLHDLTVQLANSTQANQDRFDRYMQQLGNGNGNNARKVSLKLPTIYKGDDDLHITDFTNQFQRYTQFNGINDEDKLLAFPVCLEGVALQFYESLPDGTKLDLQLLQ